MVRLTSKMTKKISLSLTKLQAEVLLCAAEEGAKLDWTYKGAEGPALHRAISALSKSIYEQVYDQVRKGK